MPQRDLPAFHHTNRRYHDPHAIGILISLVCFLISNDPQPI
jgi:hypothetical protein